jgi:hypothetical protein
MSRSQEIRNTLLVGLIAIGLTSTAFAQTSTFNAAKVYRNDSAAATAISRSNGSATDTICNTYNCGGGRRS